MHKDGCDRCGEVRELYHYDWNNGDPESAKQFDGMAVCDECNTAILREGPETLLELLNRADKAADWLQERAERHFADMRTASDEGRADEAQENFWAGMARQDSAHIVESIAGSLRRSLGA